MSEINFDQAFKQLTGNGPFPWQRDLYENWFSKGKCPDACTLPTGLGKTSVVAVWLIALANAPKLVPRRLVYVVNRRTVVDQTTTEAEKMRRNAEAAGVPVPAISTLRGQFADNREWSADPSRPAIVVGTVDMIGSRLLFSGYGIGFKVKPLHAGFLGQDVLLIHDEAHLEKPFQDLLEAIECEQRGGGFDDQRRCVEEGSRRCDLRPMRVMALTATPRGGERPFELTEEEKNAPEAARVAHTRHAMPTNQLARNYKPSGAEKRAGKYQGDPTIVFDTFVAVGRRDPVVVYWPDAALGPDATATLDRLAEHLTTLGRAEGWVHVEPAHDSVLDCNCRPAATADPNQELVPVFCADPDTAFGHEHYPPPPDAKKLKNGLKPGEHLFDCPRWHLCLDTEIIHDRRWPRVPGARWVSYARPADAFTRTVAPTSPRREGSAQPNVARFLLDGPVLPLLIDTVRVAEAVRRAVMSRFGRRCGKNPDRAAAYLVRRPGADDTYASPIFAGKDAHGQPLRTHGHAHYLPTAEGTDPRRITHVTVFARDGFNPEELAALTGLRALRAGELDLRTQLVGLGSPADFTAPLFGPARVWLSATPFVGPGHVGRWGRERSLRKSLKRELRRLGYLDEAATLPELRRLSDTSPERAGLPRGVEFRRGRSRAGDDGYSRPFGLFTLTLPTEVRGPVCVGYAGHYGLGLFVPAGPSDGFRV